MEHLDVSNIQSNDIVMGSLPVALASQVCARGAQYLHLNLFLPAELRGKELRAEQLLSLNASLQNYYVELRPAFHG